MAGDSPYPQGRYATDERLAMRTLFASPHLIDWVLLFTAVEAIILAAAGKQRIRIVAMLLLPGVCLMLGIRTVLAGAAWPWLPVALAGALVAHLADLRTRLDR